MAIDAQVQQQIQLSRSAALTFKQQVVQLLDVEVKVGVPSIKDSNFKLGRDPSLGKERSLKEEIIQIKQKRICQVKKMKRLLCEMEEEKTKLGKKYYCLFNVVKRRKVVAENKARHQAAILKARDANPQAFPALVDPTHDIDVDSFEDGSLEPDLR